MKRISLISLIPASAFFFNAVFGFANRNLEWVPSHVVSVENMTEVEAEVVFVRDAMEINYPGESKVARHVVGSPWERAWVVKPGARIEIPMGGGLMFWPEGVDPIVKRFDFVIGARVCDGEDCDLAPAWKSTFFLASETPGSERQEWRIYKNPFPSPGSSEYFIFKGWKLE